MSDTATATRHFGEKLYYSGKITGQRMAADFNKVPVLYLTVALEGQRSDHRNPTSSLLPCPKADVEVMLRFPDDVNIAQISARDLADLGFDGDDIELLNPESGKKHKSFVGQAVHVTPKYKEYNGRENCFWNLRFPKKREDRPIGKGELAKSPAARAYRDALRQMKEDQARKLAEAEDDPTPF